MTNTLEQRRLVIVENPISANASHVQREVFDRLDAHAIRYERLLTKHREATANIDDLVTYLRSGDRVVSAAGDGTASQLASAVLELDQDIEVGFLGYGNFNDNAHNHMSGQHSVLDLIRAQTVDVVPLSLEIDGAHWAHELAYFTIGWTALAAHEFGSQKSREILRAMPRMFKLGYSVLQLSDSYFRYRKELLPPLQINQGPLTKSSFTDILAVNSPQVGGVVRSTEKFYDSPQFGYSQLDLSTITPNLALGVRALLGAMPHTSTNRIDITFPGGVTDLPTQRSGEFTRVNANTISIYKNPEQALKVLHSKT